MASLGHVGLHADHGRLEQLVGQVGDDGGEGVDVARVDQLALILQLNGMSNCSWRTDIWLNLYQCFVTDEISSRENSLNNDQSIRVDVKQNIS